MNRPRNRQPRPNRNGGSNKPANHAPGASTQQRDASSRSRPGGGGGGRPYSPATPQQATGTVPTVQQVVPGASVFIVLKEDQPTGRETAGVVAELLTRGNHPRGIKVRLRSGQVGRVQRMNGDGAGTAGPSSSGSSEGMAATAAAGSPVAAPSAGRFTHRYTDVRRELDEFPEGPPARSLADFMPALPDEDGGDRGPIIAPERVEGAPVARCPVCDVFEGDEVAVTHHVEREHFG